MSEGMPALGLQPRRPDGRHLEVVPEIDHQFSRENGGFLFPNYDTGVESSAIEPYHELESRFGSFWLKRLVMSDGVKYEEVIGIPSSYTTDQVAIFTPAWFTSHREGYNVEMALDAMKLGYTAIIHSAELNASIPLSHSAHNMHMGLADPTGFDSYDPAKVVLLGDSRGAMIGFGFAAYAKKFGITISGGQLVDPCLEHQLGIDDIKHIPEYASHLLEGYSLTRQLGRVGLYKTMRYVKTIQTTPNFLMQQLRLSHQLFSGEAGNLGRAVPADQDLDLILFSKSTANHADAWEKTFEGKSVRLERRTGTHLSILNPRTRQTKIGTLERLAGRRQAA